MDTVITKKKNALGWIWLSLAVVIIDQLIKYLVIQHIEYNTLVYLLPSLNFTLVHNTGVAYGFLSQFGSAGTLFFIITAFIVSFLLTIWLYKTPAENRWMGVAIALILGGAIGNLIDRIWYGYVIDYVHFHVAGWSFAIFNFADAAITIGAVMLIIDIFRGNPNENTTR